MDYFRVDDTGLKRDLWNAVKNGSQAPPDAIRREVKRVAQAKTTVAEQHLLELLVHDAELAAYGACRSSKKATTNRSRRRHIFRAIYAD